MTGRLERLRRATRRLVLGPTNLAGLIIVFGFSLVAVFGPMLSPYDPIEFNPPERLQAPSLRHPFGTDFNGADVLSRVLSGASISMRAGITVIGGAFVLGVLAGMIAAWLGGWLDEVIMRTADVVLSFPSLLLGMILVTVLGRSLNNAVLALALIKWPEYARLTRGLVLDEVPKSYVEAARSIGAGNVRVYLVHVFRNIAGSLSVKATLDTGSAILLMASLSFLGLGASPPTPEWGAMIARGRIYILGAPWVALFPGLAVFFLVLGFSLLGDGLRDLLDPHAARLVGRRSSRVRRSGDGAVRPKRRTEP